MIFAVIFLYLVAFGFLIFSDAQNEKLKDLKSQLEEYKVETTYKFLKSEVQEFADLKGCYSYFLNGEYIYFYFYEGSGRVTETVNVFELKDKLTELKSVLEKNCPKKCKKAKK